MKKVFLFLGALILSTSIWAEPITVRLKASSLPAGWGDVCIYYWGAETTKWPGEKLTEVDGWYTKTFEETTTSISIIWNNNDKGKQTGNIQSITASTCYEITGGSGTQHTYKTVDCPGGSTTYYLVGDYCGWKFDTTAIKAFEDVNDTLTVTIDSLFGEIKITEGKSWAVNYGAWGEAPYELRAGASPYGLKQNGGQNFKFDADYKNAVFQIFMAEKEKEQVLHLRFVSGEKVVVPAHYYAKNNWGGVKDWTWLEMTAAENDMYYLDSIVFGGTGVNINSKPDEAGTLWFPADSILVYGADTLMPLDTVRLMYDAENKKLRSMFIGRPAPEVKTYYLVGDYCGWKFDTTAIKAFEDVNDTLTVTIDSLFGGIKVTEGKGWDVNYGAWGEAPYELHAGASPYGLKQGEGSQNFIFDAEYKNAVFQIFMAEKEKEQVLHLRFVSGEKVEAPAHYYAKNNWGGGEEWTWSEMTKFSDVQYNLENVVFGGTGININSKPDEAGALWFPVDSFWILTDTILPLDTIRLSYFTETKQLLVQLVARPAPVQTDTLTLYADSVWASDGAKIAAWVWGEGVTSQWTAFFAGEEKALTATFPENATGITFVRFADYVQAPDWNAGEGIWGQTGDETIDNCLTYYANGYASPGVLAGQWCSVPTALDNLNDNRNDNGKFILNGQLYIRCDNVIYDAQGKMVK